MQERWLQPKLKLLYCISLKEYIKYTSSNKDGKRVYGTVVRVYAKASNLYSYTSYGQKIKELSW